MLKQIFQICMMMIWFVEHVKNRVQLKMKTIFSVLKSDTLDPEVKFDFVYQNPEKQAKAVKAYKLILNKREIMLKYNWTRNKVKISPSLTDGPDAPAFSQEVSVRQLYAVIVLIIIYCI